MEPPRPALSIFFFQAEDGIRDYKVTGVQTCALPIFHDGKVKIDNAHMNDVDLHALVDAIRTTKDGEFVTVQSNDCDVRVAKQSNHLIEIGRASCRERV